MGNYPTTQSQDSAVYPIKEAYQASQSAESAVYPQKNKYAESQGLPDMGVLNSTSTVTIRISDLAQRADENIGDLSGLVFNTSGLGITLSQVLYSTVGEDGPFVAADILYTDLAYSFPAIGTPAGEAFNIPIEIDEAFSGNLWAKVVISYAAVGFDGNATLGNNCVHYYKLDDNAASSVVVDSAGSANGTLETSGGVPVDTDTRSELGIIDRGLQLYDGGTRHRIDISGIESVPGDIFELDKSWSVSMWILPFDNSGSTIFGSSSGATRGLDIYLSWTTGFANIYCYLRDPATAYHRGYTTTYPINAVRWNHFVLTYDGSNTNAGITIYVNTVEQTLTRSTYLSPSTIANTPFRIGFDLASGIYDEVGIWTRKLIQNEVTALYRGGLGLSY